MVVERQSLMCDVGYAQFGYITIVEGRSAIFGKHILALGE